MSETKLEPVTKAFFEEMVGKYPRELTRDVAGMADPPCLCFYDFSLGDGPENMIGMVRLNLDRDGTPNEHFWRFTLVTNSFAKSKPETFSPIDIFVTPCPLGGLEALSSKKP